MNSDLYFKDTPEGRVFYPYGVLTRGFIVDPDTELTVRRFISIWMVCLSIILFTAIFSARIFDAGLLPIGLITLLGLLIYAVAISRITSACSRASIRLTRKEVERAQGRSHSKVYLAFLIISSLVLSLGGLLMLATTMHHPNSKTVLGAVGLLFFGYGVLRFVAMARARNDES